LRQQPALHELLVDQREHFAAARELESGYLRPSKRRLVDMFVSKGVLDRSVDTLNTLFLTLERRGHRVVYAPLDQHLSRPELDERSARQGQRHPYGSWKPNRPTVTYVGTVAIGLTLFELSEPTEARYVDGRYVPISTPRRKGSPHTNDWTHTQDMSSGRLGLRASSPYVGATWERQWAEDADRTLISKIPQIVRVLESEAAVIAKLVENAERHAEVERKRWEAENERWHRDQAERRHAENTKDGREQLLAIVESWALAKHVESFFDDAERRAAHLGEGERELLRERLRCARELFGGVDVLGRFAAWRSPTER
jgi:hypothetical protein